MFRKVAIPVLVSFFLFVVIQTASAAADVIDLEGGEDQAIESFTIMLDVPASYTSSMDKEPSHGKVSFTGMNSLTYTPDLNYYGPDTFTVKVRITYPNDEPPPEDWAGMYIVTILPVNDYPIAGPVSASTRRNIPVSMALNGSDPVEGSSLTYSIGRFPEHGSLTDASHGQITEESDQQIIYTPETGFIGRDTFTYVVYDGLDYSYEAVGTITVTDSNILTVSFSGAGSGTVYSIPAGIACVPGSSAGCSVSFSTGGKIGLTQTPSAHSEFSGWSGACTGTTPCEVTMDTARTVTAAYTVIPATVHIDGDTTFYYKLGETLDVITTEGKTVRAKAETFAEDVIMTSPVSIVFKGGYSDDNFSFRAETGVTVLEGSLRIRQGGLIVERLVIL